MTREILQKFSKAVNHEKNGDFQKALSEYADLAREAPDFRPVLLNMGSLFSRMNRVDDAMNCFRKAGTLGEDYLNWFNIGSIYYKKGNFKQAVISFEKSRNLNSSFVLASLVTGLAYSRLGNLKAAEAAFSDVLVKEPENRIALNALSLLHFEKGDYSQALKYSERISKTEKTYMNSVKLQSEIHYKLGNREKSADLLKKVRTSDEAFTNYDNFIKSLPVEIYSDRYGTIEKKIETLTRKSSENASAEDLISLSLCHLFNGDSDSAIDTLFKVKNKE